MKDLSPEKLTLLATSFAIDLAKGKDEREIIAIKNFVGQVYSSLGTICTQKAFGGKGKT